MFPLPSVSIKTIGAVLLFGLLAGGSAVISWQHDKITNLKVENKLLEEKNKDQTAQLEGLLEGMDKFRSEMVRAQEENSRQSKKTARLIQQIRSQPDPVSCEEAISDIVRGIDERSLE